MRGLRAPHSLYVRAEKRRNQAVLEMRGFLSAPMAFSSNEHQGSHKIWGTQLDEAGHYQPIDLQ